MPAYEDTLFSPPAPVVRVKLRNPQTGIDRSDVPMLLDSGADVTLLPRTAIDALDVQPSDQSYELIAFDGTKSVSAVVIAELVFLGRVFRGQFLLVDQEVGILGRDVLNHVSVLLDGPSLRWEEWVSNIRKS